MDGLLRAEPSVEGPDQIDQFPVHLGGLFGAPIAHEPVELLKRFFVPHAVALVRDGDRLVGMDLIHGKGTVFGGGNRRVTDEASGAHRRDCSAQHGAAYKTPPKTHPRLSVYPRRRYQPTFPNDTKPLRPSCARVACAPLRPISNSKQIK